MPSSYSHILQEDGTLIDKASGEICILKSIDAHLVEVPHLLPTVVTFTLPKGDAIKILVRYSCHCWTEDYQLEIHDGCVFYDHTRPRSYDAIRHYQSFGLAAFLIELQQHKCYMTPSKRNYMAYNASVQLDDGSYYKVFFKLEKDRGSIDNIRHSLSLTVESAYSSTDQIDGMSIKFNALVTSVLRDKSIYYKP